jgi:alkylated DNA repair dioxygenase AlkB
VVGGEAVHMKAASRSRTRCSWRPPHSLESPCAECGRLQQCRCTFPWDVKRLLRRCRKREQLPLGGIVVRGALAEAEQEWLYLALHHIATPGSEEVEMLRLTSSHTQMAELNPDNRPQPFVSWLHPYTRLSNAQQRPAKLLDWAEQLMHALVPLSRAITVDSMLAQLYAPGGSLLRHVDVDLSWGIGVSLGSTAVFDCLPEGGEAQRVTVRSGDIMIGEFGQMPHAVCVPSSGEPAPAWWRRVDHFGTKARCNVLFRQALTAAEQRRLADARARKIYGVSLAELREQTGKDDHFLSVHLRHAAVD